MSAFIYLASQSPRRSQLLDQLGVRHTLLLPNVEGDVAEDAEAIELALPDEAPDDYVQRVTALKLGAAVARLARRGLPPAPVLCADTTVALGRRILGKPLDAQDAVQVLTAVALQAGAQRWAALSVSQVTFAELSPAHIAAYVDSGEPLGKAGSYGIQGRAAALIAHLSGSYSGIMGLPLYETAQMLHTAGIAF